MLKKKAAIFIAMVMTMTSLAACGSTDNGTSTDSGSSVQAGQADVSTEAASEDAGSDPGEVVEITFWDQNASETRTQMFNHLIEEFEKEFGE